MLDTDGVRRKRLRVEVRMSVYDRDQRFGWTVVEGLANDTTELICP